MTTARPSRPPASRPYLLIQASATHLPLRSSSVALVIATPPCLGARRVRPDHFCTRDGDAYQRMIDQFLREAARVVKPGGYVLLATNQQAGARKVFAVMRKARRSRRWHCRRVGQERFLTRFVDVKGFNWKALPVALYRKLLAKYSRPGDRVLHAFCGSGNGGMAALALGLTPVLVDLHHHKLIQRRLDHYSRPIFP